MATGIEDVLAVKALETGLVPPVPNFKEVDPELGPLNLSKGGAYPVQYAIHLGAGFGSQISMMFLRWTPATNGVRPSPDALGYAYRIADPAAWSAWLSRVAGHPAANWKWFIALCVCATKGATVRARRMRSLKPRRAGIQRSGSTSAFCIRGCCDSTRGKAGTSCPVARPRNRRRQRLLQAPHRPSIR